jgi:hypothetical protein
MRLLNVKTLTFEEFMNEKTIPKYAILSHTWGTDEVTYQDMCNELSQAVQRKTGFTKIKLACQQAKAEGLEFCWVDTCCIDKKSSAELSEAINSMFRWYSRSAVCYAYLNDVEVVAGAATDLWQSKWFTRGCKYIPHVGVCMIADVPVLSCATEITIDGTSSGNHVVLY